MQQTPYSRIDEWISEYPRMRQRILRNVNMFANLEPPKGREVSDETWSQIVQRLEHE